MRRPVELPAVALSRRRALTVLAGAAWPSAGFTATPPAPPARKGSADHFPFGPVRPERSLSPWAVTTHRGQATDLVALLSGRITALQLMFTGCSATCPIQGALFSQAQRLVGTGLPVAQFVSLSIDPLGDTPARLQAWLQGLEARAGWTAALPRVADVDAIVERLGRGGEPRPVGPDPHTGQVYLIDRQARLVHRTPSMPRAEDIVEALRETAKRSA